MRMLGKRCLICPHGRNCTDNPAPGKDRKRARRTAKRSERNAWKKEVR